MNVLHIPSQLWRTRGRQAHLRRVRTLVPSALEAATIPGGLEPAGWVMHSAQLSSTGRCVIKVGPPGGRAIAVIKMSATASGAASQRREGEAITALITHPRVGHLAALLPMRLAEGELNGEFFTIERALPGGEARLALATPGMAPSVIHAAAEMITAFHARTATEALVDAALLDRWVDRRLRLVASAVGSRHATDGLGKRLRGFWEGRIVPVGWIHGDYWLGNVLMDAASPRVTGIVDWEWAQPNELPAHDLLYLLIHSRMLIQGRELGDVVHELLDTADWDPHERVVLERTGLLGPTRPSIDREVLLLVWLRHVAFSLVQDPAIGRNWIWIRRNVERVLRIAESDSPRPRSSTPP